jgi:hypothetical protein
MCCANDWRNSALPYSKYATTAPSTPVMPVQKAAAIIQ